MKKAFIGMWCWLILWREKTFIWFIEDIEPYAAS